MIVATPGTAKPIDSKPRHLQKRKLLRLCRFREIMNRESGAERLLVGNAVRKRVLKIASNAVIRLHRDDVGTVGQEHQVVRNLQMMRAGVRTIGEEVHGLQPARIGGIQDGNAVAEHMADVDMIAVQHDLDAIGPAALIRIRKVLDTPANSLRRYGPGSGRSWRRSARSARERYGGGEADGPSDRGASCGHRHLQALPYLDRKRVV